MMVTRRTVLAVGAGLAAGIGTVGRRAAAQDASAGAAAATPVGVGPGVGATVEVVARGLVNPRGFAWLPDGRMVVAEAGSGGATARVVAVETDGTLTELLGGFPTARVVFRGVSGIADVAVDRDGALYALVAGGDINRDLARNGLYRLDLAGGAELVADVSAFIRDDPVATKPGDYDDDGQPYRMGPTDEGDGYLVTEGNSCQLLRLGFDGSVSRIADYSADHAIPTGLIPHGDEAFVATFTSAPFAPGSARVDRVALADGAMATAVPDLTMVMDLAMGPGDTPWAVEMASGFDPETGGPVPNSGRLLRLRLDQAAPMVEGLHLPAHLRIGEVGPDDPRPAFYVSGPALGADDGSGTVIRITLPDL